MGFAHNMRALIGALGKVICLLCLPTQLVFAQAATEHTQPELSQVSSGTLFFSNDQGVTQAPILETSVHIDISGIVSKVRFEQSFENTSNAWVEGLYTFPLPDKAAVHSMIVTVGERKIVGKVREKQQAKQLYEQAKRSGQVASLVEQRKPNLFSSKIANIAPQQSVSIVLEYIQTIEQSEADYGLRIPLTLTPQYHGGYASTQANPSLVQPMVFAELDAATGIDTRSHQVNITGRIHGRDSVSTVVSPSHSLSINRLEDVTEFEMVNTARLDRDFILQWSHHSEDVPTISAWRESVNGTDYVLAAINPPVNPDVIPEQARELVIVVDTSGSMAGQSIEAAKVALLDALLGLKAIDTFNIIEFNSTFTAFSQTPVAATTENITAARRFTQRLVADGGTEMLPALQHALSYGKTESLRQIVFITDGAVGFENNVIEFVSQRLRGSRLFTVGIGSAPNQWFMRKVAEAGRGTASFISDVSQAGDVMASLLNVIETPALTDLTVSFDGDGVDFTPNPVPDLYAGRSVVVAAKIGANTSRLQASGRWGNETWSQGIALNSIPTVNTGLSTVWARQKVEALEDQQRLHTDPEFFKSLITSIALEHQLLSRYTSFIAIEEQVVRPSASPVQTAAVPNALPAGFDTQTVAFPQGAAGSDTYAWLSAILALSSGLFWRRQNTNHRGARRG